MRTHLRTRRRILFSGCAVFTLLFSLLLPGTARAQFNGSISGTISDPTGAVIPGAKLKLQNEATQTAREATSSDQGFYQFGELPRGSYTVPMEHSRTRPTHTSIPIRWKRRWSCPIKWSAPSAIKAASDTN